MYEPTSTEEVVESAAGMKLSPTPRKRERSSPARLSQPTPSPANSTNGSATRSSRTRREAAESGVHENRIDRNRNDSLTARYYGDGSINMGDVVPENDINNPSVEEEQEDVKIYTTKQSRRLPSWVWYIIAKSLGIKLHAFDKPIFGTINHALTLLFGFAYAVSNTWYTVYDIKSNNTNQTVMTGGVKIIICVFWCMLGIYANKLAGKLFMNKKFVDSVRLHTRTVFKISAGGILILVAGSEIALNSFLTVNLFFDDECAKVELNSVVCQVMYVSKVCFSIFLLIWNLMVGIVLLSVCRTHTIGIRRFIKVLEKDGQTYDLIRKQAKTQNNLGFSNDQNFDDIDTDEDYLWADEEDDLSRVSDYFSQEKEILPGSPTSSTVRKRSEQRHNSDREADFITSGGSSAHYFGTPDGATEHMVPVLDLHDPGIQTQVRNPRPVIIVKEGSIANSDVEAGSVHSNQRYSLGQDEATASQMELPADSPQHSLQVERGSPAKVPSSVNCGATYDGSQSEDVISDTLRMLTVDEILLSFWKIQCRLRYTSIALQRWLIAWICFILIWSVTFIIYWISHKVELAAIFEFMLPILLLPLVCSAYGEVNNEGKRMLRCVCPTGERMRMLYFMISQPLELNAFGFAINYATIVGALGALALALCSRIILDEIKV